MAAKPGEPPTPGSTQRHATRHNVADFDHNDQALLWAALQAGQLYAVVVEGPRGVKVAFISEKDPTWSLCLSAATQRMIRVDQIDGLVESASGPDSIIKTGDVDPPIKPADRVSRSPW